MLDLLGARTDAKRHQRPPQVQPQGLLSGLERLTDPYPATMEWVRLLRRPESF
jgi:hypothetical protein